MMENVRPRKYWLNSQAILKLAITITILAILTIVVDWVLTLSNAGFSYITFFIAIALCVLSILGALIVIINYYYSRSLSKRKYQLSPQDEPALLTTREQTINALLASLKEPERRIALIGSAGSGKSSLLAYFAFALRKENLQSESLEVFSNLKREGVLQTNLIRSRIVGTVAAKKPEHWERRASFENKAVSTKRQYPLKKKKKKKKKKK